MRKGLIIELIIAAVVLLIIIIVVSKAVIHRKENKNPEKLNIIVKCIERHEYYYVWQGGGYGGPALAPVLKDDGTPRKCSSDRAWKH
jgi:hypothetical protein